MSWIKLEPPAIVPLKLLAVITLPEKLPLASRLTIVLAVAASVDCTQLGAAAPFPCRT